VGDELEFGDQPRPGAAVRRPQPSAQLRGIAASLRITELGRHRRMIVSATGGEHLEVP
jgi:hypothetical protein